MQRYLTWQGVTSLSKVQGGESEAFDFFSERVQWISWSPVSDSMEALRWRNGFRLRADAVRNGAVTVKLPKNVSLSNGALLIRYRADKPLNTVITLTGGPTVFQNEIFARFDRTSAEEEIRVPMQIFARFDRTSAEEEIRVPMPGTPGLESVSELVIRFGDERKPVPVDLTLSAVEFVPAK